MPQRNEQVRRPEEVVLDIANQLHRRWRWVVLLPMAYLVCGVWLRRAVLERHYGGEGFFPVGDLATTILLFAGGTHVVFLWLLLDRMRRRLPDHLYPSRDNPEAFLAAAKDAQLSQFLVCDLVSVPGFILFILNGDLALLAVFCIASLVCYLRALPSEEMLGRVMLSER